MQQYNSLDTIRLHNAWLTIGIFDGVHRGHQEILRPLVSGAHAAGEPAVVLTFSPTLPLSWAAKPISNT
jgi:riboflavin kinase/FMN adenylyltransferase